MNNFSLSNRNLRFFSIVLAITFLFGQFLFLPTFIESANHSYVIQIDEINDIVLADPLPIMLESRGFFIHNSSFYALGRFTNSPFGNYLFQFDFDSNFQIVEKTSINILPNGTPPLGRGFSYNGSLFWTLEVGTNQDEQKLFFFSKDMNIIGNFSLICPPIVPSMNIDLYRRDLAIWNNSLWTLEWWSNSIDDVTKANVSRYSMNTFMQISTFNIPIIAHKMGFGVDGLLWLYERDSSPNPKNNFIAISPINGSILKRIQGFTPRNIIPPDLNESTFVPYLPIIFNESILQPVMIDTEISSYLWGFQIISIEPASFPTQILVFWFLITISTVVGGITLSIYWYFYSKRKSTSTI